MGMLILGILIGFVAGFLVYRNNSKKMKALEEELKNAKSAADAISKLTK